MRSLVSLSIPLHNYRDDKLVAPILNLSYGKCDDRHVAPNDRLINTDFTIALQHRNGYSVLTDHRQCSLQYATAYDVFKSSARGMSDCFISSPA